MTADELIKEIKHKIILKNEQTVMGDYEIGYCDALHWVRKLLLEDKK